MRRARPRARGTRAAARAAPRRWRSARRDERLDGGIGPQLEHERLQDVADPAGPALLAPLHARDASGRRRRAPRGAGRARAPWRPSGWPPSARGPPTVVCSSPPATGPRWSSSITSVCGDVGEHRAQLARALGVERRARRVLPARRDDRGDARRARGARAARPASIPRSSTATGSSDRPRRAQQVVQRRVAGVLDRDAVARAQVRLQHALDRVERAADDAQLLARDAVRAQLLARERRAARAAPAAPRTGARAARSGRGARSRSGSSAGSGLPRERSRAPGGTGSGARADPIGGPCADARAAPRLGEHDPAPAQLREAGGDGDRAEADLEPRGAAPRAAAVRARARRWPPPPRCSRTSSAALPALIRYCFSSVIILYYYR